MRRRASYSIALWVFAMSTAGCNGPPTNLRADRVPAEAVALAVHHVLEGNIFSFRYYSGFTEKERLVIRDADQWSRAWARITVGLSPRQPTPSVDFAREMIVLVAMGQRLTGGYAIAVEGVYDAGGRLYVEVRELSPGGSCGTTQALTQPIDVVRVPRRDGAVVFVERAETIDCR
jgi:hypothetical protein